MVVLEISVSGNNPLLVRDNGYRSVRVFSMKDINLSIIVVADSEFTTILVVEGVVEEVPRDEFEAKKKYRVLREIVL